MATASTAPSNLLEVALAGYQGPVINKTVRETPPVQVEAEVFEAASQAFFEETEGWVLFDTPPEDMEKARGLLDLPADFPTYTCKVSSHTGPACQAKHTWVLGANRSKHEHASACAFAFNRSRTIHHMLFAVCTGEQNVLAALL
jgi:hypothetical protein